MKRVQKKKPITERKSTSAASQPVVAATLIESKLLSRSEKPEQAVTTGKEGKEIGFVATISTTNRRQTARRLLESDH